MGQALLVLYELVGLWTILISVGWPVLAGAEWMERWYCVSNIVSKHAIVEVLQKYGIYIYIYFFFVAHTANSFICQSS
jgi:hypothetical protein